MAKVYVVNKSRKEFTCSRCHKPIPVGSSYVWGAIFHGPTIYRHKECGLQSWELSGSDFIKTCGTIQTYWKEDYGVTQESVDSIKGDLEELRDETQEKFDNMPDGLQEGDTGMLLQERIEMLESVIDELDLIDAVSMQEDIAEELEDEYRSDNEIPEDAELTEDQADELNDIAATETDGRLADAIEEALSGLVY